MRHRGNLLPLPAAVPTGSGPSNAFTLVVWAKFDGDAKFTQQLTFLGRLSDKTDCDPPGRAGRPGPTRRGRARRAAGGGVARAEGRGGA